jgi:hypothetical protein
MTRKNPHAVALGRRGGRVKSEAKTRAARENGKLGAAYGKLGGRPKGTTRKPPPS